MRNSWRLQRKGPSLASPCSTERAILASRSLPERWIYSVVVCTLRCPASEAISCSRRPDRARCVSLRCRSVRYQLGHASLPCDAVDDFAPAPSRDRLVAIAVRFRKEHRNRLGVYGATLMKIRDQRRAASRSVTNNSRSTAFAGLGSDGDETSGDIEVGDAEAYQFFATQCAVVCEREHQSIAQTFPSDLSDNANPVVVRRNVAGMRERRRTKPRSKSRVIMGACAR